MPATLTTKEKWIRTGYQLFGQIGRDALNVERLSILVGLNRSSFYHHFGDVEGFEKALLDHHIERTLLYKPLIDQCTNFDPELINVVKEFPDEIDFQRQLLLEEAVPRYKACMDKSRSINQDKIFSLWAEHHMDQATTEELHLFETVRDYYLVHHGQVEDAEIEAVVRSCRVMIHGVPQA